MAATSATISPDKYSREVTGLRSPKSLGARHRSYSSGGGVGFPVLLKISVAVAGAEVEDRLGPAIRPTAYPTALNTYTQAVSAAKREAVHEVAKVLLNA